MFDSVWIFSTNRMQGELLGSFIERSLKKPCTAFSEYSDIEAACHRPVRALVLWDVESHLSGGLSMMSACGSGANGWKADVILAVFNVADSFDQQQQLVLKGVQGIFYTSDHISVLGKGLRAIENGEMWVSRRYLEQCVKTGIKTSDAQIRGDLNLTHREVEVLEQLALGASNEEIAEALCISAYTVKTHNYRIFKKINVSNRMQASLWALNALNSVSAGAVYKPRTHTGKSPNGASAVAD